ncbi:MAG: hypothetical protein AB8E82_11255, partial [Aureispira sp.]
ELLDYIDSYKGALKTMEDLDAPLLSHKLKENLVIGLRTKSFLLNRHLYNMIVSALPSQATSRGAIAQQVIKKLEIFTKEYITALYKKNKSLRVELKKYKSLSNVLCAKADFIGCFTNKAIEDKANKEHPGYKALEKSYADKVSKWLVITADSLSKYEGNEKVDLAVLKGQLMVACSLDKYDSFVKIELVKIINSCLAGLNEQEPTVRAVIEALKTKFKAISVATVTPYFDYQTYKNYTDSNFDDMVGTVLPTDVSFLDAIKAARPENTNNDPAYLAFREKYQTWSEKVIQAINSIPNTDTLFHHTQIMTNSKAIGTDEASKNVSSYVYDLASKSTKGTLLKEFIAKLTSQISVLAGKPDEAVFEAYQKEPFSFALGYPTQLKTLLKESMTKASFTEYSDKIDQWATASMDMIKEIGDSSSRLARKQYYSKRLAQELAFLFGKDIDGVEGVTFIYNDLGDQLNTHVTETIRLSQIQSYWKYALENAQSKAILKEQYYQNLILDHNPKEIENFINSLEFIFPDAIDVEAILKKCAVPEQNSPKPPVQELNSTNPNTLVMQYTLNWENRATLIELAASGGVIDEVPIASQMNALRKNLMDRIGSGVRSILPEWGNSTLDNLQEGAGNVLSGTLGTEVPSDILELSIPLKLNKQYNAGQEVVFLDVDALVPGYIGFNKQSPYTLQRVSFNKVGKTEFNGTTATHTVVAIVDIDDLALTKAVSAGVAIAGGEVSSTIGGASYTFTFSMEVVSTFNNNQLSAIVRNTAITPNNCPLLGAATATPTNTVQNFNAFR